MKKNDKVRLVAPKKKLRPGQQTVVDIIAVESGGVFPVQLPTGYGKTLTAVSVFRMLLEQRKVERLLYVVATAAQLNQFCDDGASDMADAGIIGDPAVPYDIGESPVQAINRCSIGQTVVFACTIQALTSGNVGAAVSQMMRNGNWLVVVDEHHHYGIRKAWGQHARNLGSRFLLAMSATPERKGNDGAFGEPIFRVTYLQALREGAVKKQFLHSYEYKVDAITVNGEPVSFTTSEICDAAGSSDPHAIDKFVLENKLRWSPKYVSPLVSIPVERLLSKKEHEVPQQMIVGCMGCIHAQMVCEQITAMFPGLRVDWVGTGPHGRTDEQNAEVLKKFCPPKVNGARRPQDIQLDILVHVGMAGEGLDSCYVSEIVHLNKASVTNQNLQENGRAARRVPGVDDAKFQMAIINVDSASPMAEFAGTKVMALYDGIDPGEAQEENGDGPTEWTDPWDLPEQPSVYIASCELTNIDKGDPAVREIVELAVEHNRHALFPGMSKEEIMAVLDDASSDSVFWSNAIAQRKQELIQGAEAMTGKSVRAQLRESVVKATRIVAGRAIRMMVRGRHEKSLAGDVTKRIFSKMKNEFGALEGADEHGLRHRYGWLKTLETQLKEHQEVPSWLR